MMPIKQFQTAFNYFTTFPLQEELLNNYFSSVIDEVIINGSLNDFQDTYYFIENLPTLHNSYNKWRNIFQLTSLKQANVEKLRFLFSTDPYVTHNLNYFQILMRSGNNSHLKLIYELKKESDFFLNINNYHVLLESENYDKLSYLLSLFEDNRFQSSLIQSVLSFGSSYKNEKTLKFALSLISTDITLRRTLLPVLNQFFKQYDYESIMFIDKYQQLLKGVIVCSPDNYIHLIHSVHFSECPFNKNSFTKLIDYITPRMLAQNSEGLNYTLDYMACLTLTATDVKLCKKIYEIIKELKPNLLPRLHQIYINSDITKISKIINKKR